MSNKNVSKKWPRMSWDKVVNKVEKIVFQLMIGKLSGTCFAISIGRSSEKESIFYMFATAGHVVENVSGSVYPIYLIAADGKTVCEAKAGCYEIFRPGSEVFDTALIMMKSREEIIKQSDLLPIFGHETQMPRGLEIGMVGFPGIVDREFCFFKGTISGYLHSPPTYLVDGVAINGVSGGPAFNDRSQIVGLVSSYIPNQVDRYTTLPGVSTLVPIGLIRYWMETKMKARVL